MEFGDPIQDSAIWAVSEYEESANIESDEEEALSFCDLPITEQRAYESAGLTMQWENILRECQVSNSRPSEQPDFEFGRFSTSLEQAFDPIDICPADELFYKGRLLPLSGSLRSQNQDAKNLFYNKWNSYGEHRTLLGERLQAWGLDSLGSLDSRSNYWRSISSQASRNSFSINDTKKNSQRNAAVSLSNKYQKYKTAEEAMRYSDSEPKRTENRSSCSSPKPPANIKSSLKWQFFTLGLIKTPQMKLDDMRLRQAGKPNPRCCPSYGEGFAGIDPASALRRSVSCNNEGNPKPRKEKCTNFEQKSKSVKENLWYDDQTPRSKGWRMLRPLSSLNGCKASTNSIINCSTKKCVQDNLSLADQPRRRTTTTADMPIYADQNSTNSPRNYAKLASFDRYSAGINGSEKCHRRIREPKIDLQKPCIRSPVFS